MARRKTNEVFINEVFELVGDEYSLLSEYTNKRTQVKIRHNKDICDNYEYDVYPNNLLKGTRCPKCAVINRTKTIEQFKEEIFVLVGFEFSLLSEYEHDKKKIKFRHMNESCGNHEFSMTPNSFLQGQRCPKCGGTKKKTHEEFISEMFKLVGSEYEVLCTYINTETKMTFIHNNESCKNYEFEMTPHSFLSGKRCPKCAGVARKNTELYRQEVFNLVGDEYTVLSEYINNRKHIKMRHNDDDCDNHTWLTSPNSFLCGCRCPKCYGNIKKTQEEFVHQVYELANYGYSVLGVYINDSTKLLMRHNSEKCNNFEYDVEPSSFIQGSRCPKCKSSKGEKAISEWLDKSNIFYKIQYTFEGCRDKLPLPFDFVIFNKENKLILLIEYDGKQHFEPVNFGGISDERAKENFEKIKLHDQIKNDYCKQNNIPLLRIPYWEFDNIEEILKNELIKYTLVGKELALI